MIPALEGVGMYQTELFIQDNSCTAFFANIFVAIFGLHVLSGKYALIEIKVNTILAQCFGIQLALNLFNEFINGISENEVSFEGRMGM